MHLTAEQNISFLVFTRIVYHDRIYSSRESENSVPRHPNRLDPAAVLRCCGVTNVFDLMLPKKSMNQSNFVACMYKLNHRGVIPTREELICQCHSFFEDFYPKCFNFNVNYMPPLMASLFTDRKVTNQSVKIEGTMDSVVVSKCEVKQQRHARVECGILTGRMS